jgi:hypothetical protein
METPSLGGYVAERMKGGSSKADIREELLAVGWSEEEADAAYRDGVIILGVPLPSEGTRPTLIRKSSTVDVVINFFSFILLGIIATALGTLFFGIIEQSFPDRLSADPYVDVSAAMSGIHYAVAALLIGFPLYVGALFIWFRTFREDEGRTESRLSQWLTYIVLLAASVTLVGDLIAVVFTFLQGEITWRFFLKALTVFGIAGLIFGFYFLERRKIQYHQDIPRKTFQIFGWSVAGIVSIGILLGFFVGGSPETARKQGFDARRANDLSTLAGCIQGYASDFGALPDSIDVLRRSSTYAYCASFVQDPETGKMYEYRVVASSRMEGESRVGEFELCADFSLASSGSREMAYPDPSFWSEHGAGRSCDTATAQLGTLAPVVPIKK